MTVSEDLAGFITRLKYNDIPSGVVDVTKTFLADSLGVAIGGAVSKQGQAIQAFLKEVGGPEEATVLGTRLRTSRLQAALGNGVLMRALELEDTFEEGFFHSAPGTIGAALALAEDERPTGKELLTAVALGYEVGVRISRSISPSHASRGYHPTGTCGSFGATVAAAKLMGLTESQTASALGIAGLQAAGIMQSSDPSWRYLTAINGGRAAQLGVTAALLARNGFQSSAQIFEAADGFSALHADAFDNTVITRNLGSEYLMPVVGIKLYPSSRPTHSPIAAAIQLKERHGIQPESVESVVVGTFTEASAMADKPTPQTELDAQGSIQFLVAVVLTRGSYTIADVSPDVLNDTGIQQLMAKIKLVPDTELDVQRQREPSSWPAVVEVRMVDGASHVQRLDSPPGSAANPATAQQLSDKFHSLATRVLPDSQAQELWDRVGHLEAEDDLSGFIQLWEPPS